MTTIVIDGLNEEDFRRSIENRLREGAAAVAIERLRTLIASYAGPGCILPERFLSVNAADFILKGWDTLGDAVSRYDRPGRPVTALSIAFGWPGEKAPEPDAQGRSPPHIETSYFSDDAFPFSQCGRDDLLEGYSYYGCNWAGDSEAIDAALSLDGIDDLYGALANLEARLLDSDEPDEDGMRAGSLGSCMLSALLFQAVGEQVVRAGLPRPLCVTAGSNGVYPYFDAPVVGMPEEAIQAAEAQQDLAELDSGVPVPRYASLLMTGIPRGKKRAVLVLEETDDDSSDGIAQLPDIGHDDGEIDKTSSEAVNSPLTVGQFETPGSATFDGPLLASKPDRTVQDLPNVPGRPEAPTAKIETPPLDQSNSSKPPVTVTPSDDYPRPGFTLLEPDPPQPLGNKVFTYAPSFTEAIVSPSLSTRTDCPELAEVHKPASQRVGRAVEPIARSIIEERPSRSRVPLGRSKIVRFVRTCFAAVARSFRPRRGNTRSRRRG